jgi:hypothetical protein
MLCNSTTDINVPPKPWMQVAKRWCLLRGNWIGLGNAGGGVFFEKVPKQPSNLQAPKNNKKDCSLLFSYFIFINSNWQLTTPIKISLETATRARDCDCRYAAAHARSLEGTLIDALLLWLLKHFGTLRISISSYMPKVRVKISDIRQ